MWAAVPNKTRQHKEKWNGRCLIYLCLQFRENPEIKSHVKLSNEIGVCVCQSAITVFFFCMFIECTPIKGSQMNVYAGGSKE